MPKPGMTGICLKNRSCTVAQSQGKRSLNGNKRLFDRSFNGETASAEEARIGLVCLWQTKVLLILE
ncbi:MAG: hypothetical protein QXH03_03295 [Candidatus Bathyarchaeia archaeon]